MPAATAAAEPEEEPPGVCSGLRGLRVTDGCKRCKLRGHGLAEDDGAGGAQRRDAGRILGGLAALEGGAAVLGRHVGGVDDVLDADGNPVQRADALAFLARCASAALACASARSRSRKAQAWICGSSSAMRSRQAPTSSSEVSSPSQSWRSLRRGSQVAVSVGEVGVGQVRVSSRLPQRALAQIVERAGQEQGEGERHQRGQDDRNIGLELGIDEAMRASRRAAAAP